MTMTSTLPPDASAGTAGGPVLRFAQDAAGTVIACNDGPRLGIALRSLHGRGRSRNSSAITFKL